MSFHVVWLELQDGTAWGPDKASTCWEGWPRNSDLQREFCVILRKAFPTLKLNYFPLYFYFKICNPVTYPVDLFSTKVWGRNPTFFHNGTFIMYSVSHLEFDVVSGLFLWFSPFRPKCLLVHGGCVWIAVASLGLPAAPFLGPGAL